MNKILKLRIITILLLINVLASFSLSYAYWASSVLGNSGNQIGNIGVGTWDQDFFIFVTNDGLAPGTIRLVDITDLTLNYKLVENITLSASFTPLGWNGSSVTPFTGIFDGNGFNIIGMNITTNGNYQLAGLFARNEGVIRNVSLLNVSITHSLINNSVPPILVTHIAGAIAGENDGEIINSYAQGTLSMTISLTANNSSGNRTVNAFAGGLAGINTGSIQDSHVNINVSTNTSTSSNRPNSPGIVNAYAGGLVGSNQGIIERTYAQGNVTAQGAITRNQGNSTSTLNIYAGGLVGQNLIAASVSRSFALGNVTASTVSTLDTRNIYYGGLIGGLVGEGTFLNNYRPTSGQTVSATGPSGTNLALNGEGEPVNISNFRSNSFVSNSSNLGWDTTTIWFVDEGVQYPVLRNLFYS